MTKNNIYKVMLIRVDKSSIDYDRSNHETNYLYDVVKETDDWEEICEKDYKVLQKWVYSQNENGLNSYYRLITLDNSLIPMGIEKALELAKKETEARARKEKKNQEAAAKRAKTRAANKRKRDLKKLQQLKDELNVQ